MTGSVTVALCKAIAGNVQPTIDDMRALMAELDRSNDRVAELEEILGLKLVAPPSIHLPPLPLKILGLLLTRERVSYSTIETALYGDRPLCDWPTFPSRSIKVHVHHLRTRLAGHGISFDIIFAASASGGYFMSAEMKVKTRKMFNVGAP